jgi:hypothetical protein
MGTAWIMPQAQPHVSLYLLRCYGQGGVDGFRISGHYDDAIMAYLGMLIFVFT